jgi:hypothetical protein
MARTVQRLRYFDGEFLRSGDMTDEQDYHVWMRRSLTLGLHPPGIVTGALIQQDANSVPPSLLFFSISAGLVIDQTGREILIAAPFVLSSDNVLGQAGLVAGANEVWIVYQESAAGLPQTGYAQCDDPSQNTRIDEGFTIALKPRGVALPKGAKDPDTDLKGIRLGTIVLMNDPVNGWTITGADAIGRTYVGVRAQSIVAPYLPNPDTFSVVAQNVAPPAAGASAIAPAGYIDVDTGMFIRGNTFIEENLVVGDDFKLDNAVYPKLPAPASIPAKGNVKLNGDLFLNGAFYGFLNGTWLGLGDYIKSLMPDVQTGFQDFDLTNTGGATTGANKVTVTTTLTSFNIAKLEVNAAVAGFTLVSSTNFSKINPSDTPQVLASAVPVPKTAQSIELDVTWTVSPSFTVGLQQMLPLASVRIFWLVIFRP